MITTEIQNFLKRINEANSDVPVETLVSTFFAADTDGSNGERRDEIQAFLQGDRR